MKLLSRNVLVSWCLLSASALGLSAQQTKVPFDSETFCGSKHRCPYFRAVFHDDDETRQALIAAFDAANIAPPSWLFRGVESPVTRVRSGRKMLVLGPSRNWQPHARVFQFAPHKTYWLRDS